LIPDRRPAQSENTRAIEGRVSGGRKATLMQRSHTVRRTRTLRHLDEPSPVVVDNDEAYTQSHDQAYA
jgi:hypothetical protein